MNQAEDCGSSSSIHPIIEVHSFRLAKVVAKSDKKSYFADNLAFACDEEAPLTINGNNVYKALSEPHSEETIYVSSDDVSQRAQSPYHLSKCHICRAVLAGIILAISILIVFFWVHIRYLNPNFIQRFDINLLSASPSPLVQEAPALPVTAQLLLRSNRKFFDRTTPTPTDSKSVWQVDYDVPAGIPFIKLLAPVIEDMEEVKCPQQKFALALYLEETHSALAENWFKECGKNVAYFRVDGSPSFEDIDRLLVYFKNTQFLSLKASLKVERGGNILYNQDFIRTKKSDDVIRNLEISGYVTQKTIEALVEAAPYTEELTIKGDEVCKSLKRSLRNSDRCGERATWHVLQKLHIFQTQECRDMYDLIYSCWDMPLLETVQVRQSIITEVNGNFIKGILDKYRIMRVDFADNVCYDDTLVSYPFMCQASS